MKTSLLRRIILAQAAAMGLLWLLTFVLTICDGYAAKNASFDENSTTMAEALVMVLQSGLDEQHLCAMVLRVQDLDEKHTPSEDMHSGEYKARYQIQDASGRMIFHTASAPGIPYANGAPGFHMVGHGAKALRVLIMDTPDGKFRVQVAESLALRHRIVWRALGKSPLSILIIFTPIALFTWLVSRRTLRPLRLLAEAVEARAAGDLHPLDSPYDIKETRPLVTALNRMFLNLSELLETQRRFVADAAHAMRTPLAVLQAQIHALQHAADDTQRAEQAQELQRGLARTTAVVHQLLAVARLEGAEPAFHKIHLDLGQLARERLELMAPVAMGKEQDLGIEGPEHLEMEGDPAILATAVDNLLENAIKYTPRNGIITLRLGAREQTIWLAIEDNGPGIPEAFRGRAIERFTRGPGMEEPGAGLGLSIVSTAVNLHGGSLALATPDSGMGLLARMELPQN